MDDVFKDPVQLSKGINLNDLLNSEAEFHLDMDFKTTKDGIDLTEYGDMMPDANDDDDDSDTDDIFGHVEKKAEQMMLSSPEYLSFDELAAKMVDVPCRPSGAVKITILEEGDGSLVPGNAAVSVHYAAYWERANVPFESSLTINDGSPTMIQLGTGRCLPGLELALTSVRGPNARILALMEPQVLWGAAGVPPRIRAERALFVVALYSVGGSTTHHQFSSLPVEQQRSFPTTVSTALSLFSAGKEYFQRRRYKQAVGSYQRALHVLSLSRPVGESETREVKRLRVRSYVNLAVCYTRMDKPQHVIDMCDNIDQIIFIETHCKALFYKGKANQMLGRLDEALLCYKKALKLEPNNKEIGTLLAELDDKMRSSLAAESDMWRRAFGNEQLSTNGRAERDTYNVDPEFEMQATAMCDELASSHEYARVEFPMGLTGEETRCVVSLAARRGLRSEQSGAGTRRRLALLKRVV